ncbi:MAG: helix-hairpin-helix domain-containing protein [Flavobacterium sp.]|nr:helix-hairpin-helix domain-containing protein [Flavobacterium sp.]
MKLKSYFQYSKSQRSGIFLLVLLCVICQFAFFYLGPTIENSKDSEKQKWISLQSKVDSLKVEKQNYVPKIYPFNPNFITDYKGSKLGMSVAEIDRLLNFRKTNQYVNSALEFQKVTQVSDSLLSAISPYFKFPDWVNKRKANNYKPFEKKTEKIVLKDINIATKEDLIKVYGIGPALSDRILKQKGILGGFVSLKQMDDIWGLSPEVIENLNKYFIVTALPRIKKIDINNASIKELMLFPYFKYALAKSIVTYRSMNGDFKNSEDLTKINDFPSEKLDIISLYLEF